MLNLLLETLKLPLRHPAIFAFQQWLAGIPRVQRILVEEHLRPFQGARILDIGCGPGLAVPFLPEGLHYVGIDISEAYIAKAQGRYGHRGKFICGDIRTADLTEFGPFDAALAFGVLHHLDDDRVHALLRLAKKSVRPGGRLVTNDPAYAEGQSWLERFLLGQDRGKYVRHHEEYLRLARPYGQVSIHVASGVLRHPYTLATMEIVF